MSKGTESFTLPDHAETTLRSIPEELKEKDIWICWTPSKKPINPRTLGLSSKTDPDTWTDLQSAVEAVRDGKDGIYETDDEEFITEPVCGLGVAVTDENVLIDVDGCIDDQGNLKKYVDSFISRFDSWTEISQSGNGLHILIKYGKEIPKNLDLSPDWLVCDKLEIYQDQFVFLTGDHHKGTPSRICPAREPLDALFDYLREKDQLLNSSDRETCSRSDVEPKNDLDDEQVLDLLKSESEELRDIVENGYLSERSENQPDVSRFDWSLLNKLWFYSGNDREQTIRLFRQILSKQNRPRRNYKLYDDHYVNRTINNIQEENSGAYTGEKEVDPEKQEMRYCQMLWMSVSSGRQI